MDLWANSYFGGKMLPQKPNKTETTDLDEDEMMRFMSSHTYNCPYFGLDDEYGIVRKQN